MSKASRELESRAHEMRDTYATDYISGLSIPPGVAKEGYSYHWARKDVKGQDDFRIEELVAKGWTPVPAERATNQYFGDPLERNPLSKKFICCKDLILMERPEIYSIQERQRFNDYNNNRLKSLRGVSNDLGTFGRTNTVINSF